MEIRIRNGGTIDNAQLKDGSELAENGDLLPPEYLVIVIDITTELGDSSSGKSRIIANSHGMQSLEIDDQLYDINLMMSRRKNGER